MTQQNFTVDNGLTVTGTGGNITGVTNLEVTANVTAGNLVTLGDAGAITMSGGNIDGVGNVVFENSSAIYESTATISGVGTVVAVEIAPAGALDADQRLVVYPTANEGNHIHLTSGNLQVTDVILGDDTQYIRTSTDGSMIIGTDSGIGAVGGNQWSFGVDGNLTVPGNVLGVAGDYNQPNFITPNSSDPSWSSGIYNDGGANFWMQTQFYGDNNPAHGVRILDNSSNTVPFSVNGLGNVTVSNGISAVGNVTAANFIGNGSQLTNVLTKTTGQWTVSAGTNNYSFTVPASNTYVMWIEGNIPNGIIAWNASATVTNTNVPVLGQQFAWNYAGAGTPLGFTSLPNQFVGTAGAISNASPAVANTNTFTFGINNTSGSDQTVRYGWTKVSNI